MSFVVFRCNGCGSPIEAQPDNLLSVCVSCGNVYPAKELGDVPIAIIASPSESEVRAAVRERMAGDRSMKNVAIELKQVEGVYIPLFVHRTKVEGRWKGYDERKRGKRTVKDWKSGELDQEADYPVLARKHAHEFGMLSLGRTLFKETPVPFESIEWTSMALSVLSVDMDEAHATLAVQDDLIDAYGEQIKREYDLDAITEFEATVDIKDRFIVLYPFWTVVYSYDKGSYRVAVGGSRAEVLAAMEPVFLGQRIFHLAAGALGIVGAGLLWCIGWSLLAEDGLDDAGEFLVAIGAGIGWCMWQAWRTAEKLVTSVDVERLGEKKGWFK